MDLLRPSLVNHPCWVTKEQFYVSSGRVMMSLNIYLDLSLDAFDSKKKVPLPALRQVKLRKSPRDEGPAGRYGF